MWTRTTDREPGRLFTLTLLRPGLSLGSGMADAASDLMLVYTLSLVAIGVVIGAGTAQGAISFLSGFLLSLLVTAIWFAIWYRGIRR